MAHVVLTAVVSTFLNQSTSPLLEEIFLLYNYKNELKKLENTVGVIRNVLQDAEERQSHEHLTQGWLSKITVVMYDADDLLDQVVARALQKRAMKGYTFVKEVQLFFSKSNHLAFVLQTSNGVKGISKSLDNITKDMERFKFSSIPRPLEDRRPLVRVYRETQSFVQGVVFGREKEKEDIINLLLSNNIEHQGIPVIAIHGFGGLGKTTLAQLVYNDVRVKGKFELCIWVCINYFTSLEKVLITIIKSCRKKPTNLGLEQLQIQLRRIISGKRCLLVLDDVWDEDTGHWNSLKPFFDCTRNDSKVLVTTRSKKVSECLGAFECYKLGVLSKESAWCLLEKMYFKEQELIEDPWLKSLGEQIAYKCGYVPLALMTIGSLFRQNGKVHRLKLSSLNQELSKVVSLGENQMMQTLKISYDDLPSNMKLCFAYCSLFPKDYTFEKDELVRLWLAQGFLVPQVCGKSFEGEGEDFFFYLVERCFFQEIQQVEKQGCSRSLCKMHDLFHDLAKEVSRIEYRVIEEVTDELKGKAFRHIAFNCELDSSLRNYHSLFSASKASRTLIFSPQSLKTNSLRTLLRRFRRLRTLDLSCMELVRVSKSIGELIHLRYLNLSENENLKYLPNAICKLPHLQTLNLSWCKSLEKLPSTIGKLARLRYLILNGCENLTFLPPGISALTSLVSLDRLIVHQQEGGLRYLNCLDNLSGNMTIKLPMKGWLNSEQDANQSNMFKKGKLNGLTIEWERSEIDSDDQRMPRSEVEEVLRALHPNDDLQYLKITECNASKLPTWLSSHKNIEELNLQCWHEIEYMEDSMDSNPSFPYLKILTIENMSNLKGWWREATTVPCFPRVSKVDIRRCPKLSERMPLFRQIEELTLSSVAHEAVEQLLTVSIDNSNRLKKLKLEQIEDLKCMPYEWIQHLTALETLVITSCTELDWVSRGGLRHLTALEELKIEESGKVELLDEYCEMEDEDGLPWEDLKRLRVLELPVRDEHFDQGLQYLSALEDLAIYSFQQKEDRHYKGIQYLAAQQGIDIFDWVREEDKEEVNCEIVEEDEEEKETMPWKTLERLRKLTVGFDQKPWRFPKEIECLHCLEHLTISDCRELSISWIVLVKLKRLRSLTFCRVENVILVDEVMDAPMNNMASLKFEECHGELEWMNQMPWDLLPSLHSLAFVYMPDLENLPDGIQRLRSLQQLEIISCQNLKSLPNWMISLTSLQSLVIAVCSNELNKRCVEETGADRPHIGHIPYIHIW